MGIILKIFFTGRFIVLSTIMYLVMGWMTVLAIDPIIETVTPTALWLLGIGGFILYRRVVLFPIGSHGLQPRDMALVCHDRCRLSLLCGVDAGLGSATHPMRYRIMELGNNVIAFDDLSVTRQQSP